MIKIKKLVDGLHGILDTNEDRISEKAFRRKYLSSDGETKYEAKETSKEKHKIKKCKV